MSHEAVEVLRRFAKRVAEIDPKWVCSLTLKELILEARVINRNIDQREEG